VPGLGAPPRGLPSKTARPPLAAGDRPPPPPSLPASPPRAPPADRRHGPRARPPHHRDQLGRQRRALGAVRDVRRRAVDRRRRVRVRARRRDGDAPPLGRGGGPPDRGARLCRRAGAAPFQGLCQAGPASCPRAQPASPRGPRP
jgi:hypothetical protein